MPIAGKLEGCTNNTRFGSNWVLEQAKTAFATVQTAQFECLGYCELCARRPYVLIDDKVVIEAADAKELWERVQQYYNSQPAGCAECKNRR
ncbi:YuzB family protein [Alicyclobacillus tolerans]|uniref:DUF1450 domain-containing protein n=1 Tax=Alicyclobacillus tolerans TaxID=90970 RepID=UPI001F40E63E|nr:DUF1450 domain-containing protein [Alicyclobacillus tolerans]MCF8566361.1 YuzB family protein [Alicyclobacillus tolerans]